MKSLKDVCLKNICENLRFNHSIFEKLNLRKVPLAICDSIYSFYSENIEDIDERDLEIFTSSFFTISSLIINRKFIKFPQFFSKINTKMLKKVNCIINEENYINCLKNLFKNGIERIEIFNIQFFTPISIHYMPSMKEEDNEALELISDHLGENFIELRIVFSIGLNVSGRVSMKLLKILEKNKNLKIFEFQNVYCMGSDKCLQEVHSIHNNLEKMYINIPTNARSLKVNDFFNKFPNLVELSINLRSSNLLLTIKGLLPLKMTLKKLEIFSNDLLDAASLDFILIHFKSLNELHFSRLKYASQPFKVQTWNNKGLLRFRLTKPWLTSNDLNAIIFPLQKHKMILDEITVDRFYVRHVDEIFCQDLRNLSKLSKIVNAHLHILDSRNFPSFIKDFKNINFNIKLYNYPIDKWFSIDKKSLICSNSISCLKLTDMDKENFKNCNISEFFSNFHCLETMSFKDSDISEIFKDICIGLKYSLKKILFSNCQLRKENGNCLKTLIRNCKTLESLKIHEDNRDLIDESILREIEKTSLTYLSISCFYIVELLNTLKNLKKLEYFNLNSYLSIEDFNKMSNILNNLHYTFSKDYYCWKSINYNYISS